jgi:hypothetical protein
VPFGEAAMLLRQLQHLYPHQQQQGRPLFKHDVRPQGTRSMPA